MDMEPKKCVVCGTIYGRMKRCSGCHSTIYCSTKCQKIDWPEHRNACSRSTRETKQNLGTDVGTGHKQSKADLALILKHNGQKSNILVSKQWPGGVILKMISGETKIPFDDMKVIVKGKIQTEVTITENIYNKALVMVIGTPCEAADGLDERDIECLMSQMNIDRNCAVKSLRKCGTLLDAMLDIGNR